MFRLGNKRWVHTPQRATIDPEVGVIEYAHFNIWYKRQRVEEVCARIEALIRRNDSVKHWLSDMAEDYLEPDQTLAVTRFVRAARRRDMAAVTIHQTQEEVIGAPELDTMIGVAAVHPGHRLFYRGLPLEGKYTNCSYWVGANSVDALHDVVARDVVTSLPASVLTYRDATKVFAVMGGPDHELEDGTPRDPQHGFPRIGSMQLAESVSLDPHPTRQQASDGFVQDAHTRIFLPRH